MDMKAMTNTDKALAWLGLSFGGGLSIAGNLVAATLPALDGDIEAWRKLPTAEPGMTSLVAAVAVPFAAVLLVEMLNRWTFLSNVVRRGAIGTVAFIAASASWVHLFTVMLHEGNHPIIAAAVPLIPDTIAIVSAMALLSGVRADTDKPTPPVVQMSTDNGQPDSASDMDITPDTVPDMDTLPVAPADIVPVQRRPIADKAWKIAAAEMIRNGDPAKDREIAEKILANNPETWAGEDPIEAGRKAVARLRKAL